MIYTFLAVHGDAVGVAVIAAGAAVLGGLWLDHAHQRTLRAQRNHYRSMATAERTRLHAYYQKLYAALSGRPSFDDTVTDAIDVTRPVRTALDEAYVGGTVADVPSPYVPAFYSGGAA